MTRKAAWLAAFVVLVSNAVALGFAWRNRSGEPEAELVLTEREVRILPREAENTAITMRLAWVNPTGAPGAVSWFDAAKLAGLGFDCSVPVTSQNFAFYRGQAPRAAYAAFELEGDGWSRYLAAIPPGPDRDSAEAGSHLVLIDAGLDPAALRARHPDRTRVVIAPATVGLEVRRAERQPPVLAGRLHMIYPTELSVPRHLRGLLEGVPNRPQGPYDPRQSWRGSPLPGGPRYQVSVRWGRALEPWLVAVHQMPTHLSGKNSVAEARQ